MRDRLLLAALLLTLAAIGVLALASFGGAANGLRNGRARVPTPAFNPARSKFTAVAEIVNNHMDFDKGFAGAFGHPSTGVYCVTSLSPSKINPFARPALVQVDWQHSSGSSLMAFTGGAECPGVDDYEVKTYDTSSNPSDSVAFVIAVY